MICIDSRDAAGDGGDGGGDFHVGCDGAQGVAGQAGGRTATTGHGDRLHAGGAPGKGTGCYPPPRPLPPGEVALTTLWPRLQVPFRSAGQTTSPSRVTEQCSAPSPHSTRRRSGGCTVSVLLLAAWETAMTKAFLVDEAVPSVPDHCAPCSLLGGSQCHSSSQQKNLTAPQIMSKQYARLLPGAKPFPWQHCLPILQRQVSLPVASRCFCFSGIFGTASD